MQVQSAAKHGLRLLDQTSNPEAAFARLFLSKQKHVLAFDAFWRVSVPLQDSSTPQAQDVLSIRWLELDVSLVSE